LGNCSNYLLNVSSRQTIPRKPQICGLTMAIEMLAGDNTCSGTQEFSFLYFRLCIQRHRSGSPLELQRVLDSRGVITCILGSPVCGYRDQFNLGWEDHHRQHRNSPSIGRLKGGGINHRGDASDPASPFNGIDAGIL